MIIVQGRWMSLTGERGLLPLVVTETKTPRCRQVVPLSPPRSGGCARCAPISGSSGWGPASDGVRHCQRPEQGTLCRLCAQSDDEEATVSVWSSAHRVIHRAWPSIGRHTSRSCSQHTSAKSRTRSHHCSPWPAPAYIRSGCTAD